MTYGVNTPLSIFVPWVLMIFTPISTVAAWLSGLKKRLSGRIWGKIPQRRTRGKYGVTRGKYGVTCKKNFFHPVVEVEG